MSRFRAGLSRLGVVIAVGMCAPIVPRAGHAQENNREQTFRFDITAASLGRALTSFSETTGIQLVYTSELVKGKESPGLSGTYSAQDALASLLGGSGIVAKFTGPKTVALVRGASNGSRVLGPVRIEGAQTSATNGVNGSRDITATENSGSYTSNAMTIGSKSPLSIKDTPQSVSVITAQRLDDQNIVDFAGAMNQATGITMVHGGTGLSNTFYSRGFAITSIQVDGGAPLSIGVPGTNGGTNSAYFPQIDMAQYDHVEILRGADGLFNGYGDPSGSINLVRKKPLDHPQVKLEAQVGSWNNYRTVLDATAPLGFDGALRGRAVVSYQDNDYYYSIANDNKTLIYGVMEYDLTPTTLLSGGVSFTRQDTVPAGPGLPRYQNGDDLKLPRDTCLCFPWNRWDFDTTEIFANLEQRIGEDWTTKLNLTHSRQESYYKIGYGAGTVNPLTNAGTTMFGDTSSYFGRQLSAEVTASGAFELLGQRQQIVVGVNHSRLDGGGRLTYTSLLLNTAANPYIPYPGGPAGIPTIDVFTFNPYALIYTEPRNPLPAIRQEYNERIQSGAYINLNLTAFDRLHLITGVRYTQYEQALGSVNLCTAVPATGPCIGKNLGDPNGTPSRSHYDDRNISWPPSVSFVYDVTHDLSTYLGYTDIYISQANNVDRDLEPLGPITGSNFEVGVKWAPADKLNANLAVYYIKQRNFAQAILDPRFTDNNGHVYARGWLDPTGSVTCCYTSNPDRALLSRGLDAEVTGEVLPGWQMSAGYTFNKNEEQRRGYSVDGQPLVSRQPEHLLKLWTTYEFSNEAALRGVTIGAGVNAQSSAFMAGAACVQLNPPNAQGISTCAPGMNIPYDYTQPTYAVWSARIGYRLNDTWSIAFNTENLTDVRYYQTMGTNGSGNWYGEPRNYMLSVSGGF